MEYFVGTTGGRLAHYASLVGVPHSMKDKTSLHTESRAQGRHIYLMFLFSFQLIFSSFQFGLKLEYFI